jgi:hypothetical protein
MEAAKVENQNFKFEISDLKFEKQGPQNLSAESRAQKAGSGEKTATRR